jgi:hypothetical protein
MLAVILAVLAAALAAAIMAEYEFESYTPFAAGLAVGVLSGEIVAGVGRWKTVAGMVVAAAIATGGLLYGAWLESDSGVEPFAALAWPAAALAALVAAYSVRPFRASPRTSAGS